MAPIKDDNFLIIQPGSQFTLFSFGLNQESLALPHYKIPTKVYLKSKDVPEEFTSKSEDESLAVYPIIKGEIVNVNALNYLLKIILKSIHKISYIIPSNVALTLIGSNRWSKLDIEYITHYAFESLQIGNFTILPLSLCANFSFGSIPNSLVIDVGHEKTEITPIIDYQVMRHLSVTVNKGSQSINKNLSELLPELTLDQIESLKLSPIYEILSEEDAKNSFFGLAGIESDDKKSAEDDGILDVAAIVTSDRNTRDLLEEKSKNKVKIEEEEETKPNSELEKNTFIDNNGNEITIGKERFQGHNELLSSISFNVQLCVEQISDLRKRQECFDNVILVGATTKINGFKDSLLVTLLRDHLIAIKGHYQAQQATNAEAAFRNDGNSAANSMNKMLVGSNNETFNSYQVPKSIKYCKFPDYFPEWKKAGNFEDVSFLGGQILSKQIFGTGHGNNNGETLYLNKESYLESGPLGIWDVSF
ncbi:hypothetical protein PACTADRAFT_51442 [Pachysolen tannophilus NRRL Y-2460]|uniref:Actin-like protein ARP9 n=1 Tax=Pachysolen tannophilus NRRL Y-2460 TaxID=669874 RepID=A0A1E4TPI9_PACTA|nr:hypothetical protein PACTADRAFT_51442 [Pachysolen tannophilus NRRL Y-2460]